MGLQRVGRVGSDLAQRSTCTVPSPVWPGVVLPLHSIWVGVLSPSPGPTPGPRWHLRVWGAHRHWGFHDRWCEPDPFEGRLGRGTFCKWHPGVSLPGLPCQPCPTPTSAKISRDSARSGFSRWASLAWFHRSRSQFRSSVPLSPSSPKEKKVKFPSNSVLYSLICLSCSDSLLWVINFYTGCWRLSSAAFCLAPSSHLRPPQRLACTSCVPWCGLSSLFPSVTSSQRPTDREANA